jgi:hypothetical protein
LPPVALSGNETGAAVKTGFTGQVPPSVNGAGFTANVQLNVAGADCALSVTVMETGKLPGSVGVPVAVAPLAAVLKDKNGAPLRVNE